MCERALLSLSHTHTLAPLSPSDVAYQSVEKADQEKSGGPLICRSHSHSNMCTCLLCEVYKVKGRFSSSSSMYIYRYTHTHTTIYSHHPVPLPAVVFAPVSPSSALFRSRAYTCTFLWAHSSLLRHRCRILRVKKYSLADWKQTRKNTRVRSEDDIEREEKEEEATFN